MWISVKEELPRKTERVLVYGLFGSHAVIPAVYEHDGTWRVYGRGARVEDVTHWMPLPDPPSNKAICRDCAHWCQIGDTRDGHCIVSGKISTVDESYSCHRFQERERCTCCLTRKDVRDIVLEVIKEIGAYLSE